MNYRRLAALVACAVAIPSLAFSSPYKEDEEEQGHVDSPTYRYFVSPDDQKVSAHMARDLKFADEMTEHHRGAVRMSEAYLQDPRGTNPFLQRMANAIIYNQQFEIGWLQDLKQRVSAGPEEVVGMGDTRVVRLPMGITGMEHRERFQPAPILSVTNTIEGSKPISEYDVMFAKGMRMHHQMALEMAHAYNNDPAGGNLVIREINRGIIRDQMREIGFLNDLISEYPGDPDAVEIPQEMHDMMGMPMDHMNMNMDMQHQN
jgi:uncharacterized protein (DUF305 family)